MTYTNATTLVEFLRARWGERQQWAQDVLAVPDVGLHGIARYVLADVEAKRQLMRGHVPVVTAAWWDLDGVPHDGVVCDEDWNSDEGSGELWPCRLMRLLALPYAEHPDYDQSWRPAEVTA